MPARFTAYPSGLAYALQAAPMREALRIKAEKVKARAEAIAPVRTGQYRYGRLLKQQRIRTRIGADGTEKTRNRRQFAPLPKGKRGGFRVIVGVRNGKAYARVIALAPYSVYLEFGTRYMRRQRILGRAAAALRT